MSGAAGPWSGSAANGAKAPSRAVPSVPDARSNFGSANKPISSAGSRAPRAAANTATNGLASASSPKRGGASGERYGKRSAKAKLAAQAIATTLKPDSRSVRTVPRPNALAVHPQTSFRGAARKQGVSKGAPEHVEGNDSFA